MTPTLSRNGRFAAAALLTVSLLASCSGGPAPQPDPNDRPGVEDTLKPTLELTSPQEGSSVSGSLLLEGRVSDNVGLSRLTYRFGNGNEQTLTLPADGVIRQNLCLCGLQAGTYTLTVTAYDAAGNSTSVTRTVTVTPGSGTGEPGDTAAPTLTLTSPASGASLNNPVRLTATASDNRAVTRLTYQLDGAAERDLDVTPGPTVNLDTTLANLPAGSHTLVVRAYDAAGNASNAASTTFIVISGGTQPGDTVAPRVTLTAPVNGSSVTAPVRVQGRVTDNQAVTRVTYAIDNGPEVNTPITAGASVNLDFALPDLAAGQHTLVVKAYDAAGNASNAASTTFTVTSGGAQPGDTVAPTLTLTSPVGGASVNNPVRLTGTASDNQGVTRVTYTVDNGPETNLAITPGRTVNLDTTLPDLAAGQHTLVVRAYDAAGNASNAASVSITVRDAQAAQPQPLVGAGYSVNAGRSELCLLCSVDNAANVVNSNLTDEASMKVTVGALAYTYVRVIGTEPQAAGRRVGFVVRRPGSPLDLGVLPGLTLVTLLNGQVQETRSGASLLDLALLAPGDEAQTVSFQTSKAFDSVELRFGGVVGALTELRVRYAFVQ